MTAGEGYVAITPPVMAFSMLGFWAAAVLGRNVPEITSRGAEIWLHIAAEAVTALLLIA